MTKYLPLDRTPDNRRHTPNILITTNGTPKLLTLACNLFSSNQTHVIPRPTITSRRSFHILNLFGGDETPYESLHVVISSGIKPWFDAFLGTRGGGKYGDSKMGA
jgi:hypothetical protein